MSRNQRNIGELEFQVLKVLWEHQPCSVQEVAALLSSQRNYARTTILTIIQRLHAKGLLTRRKENGIFRYSAREDRRSTVSRLIKRFVGAFLDNSPLPLVAYLSETKKLDPAEAAELRRIVDEWESQNKEQP